MKTSNFQNLLVFSFLLSGSDAAHRRRCSAGDQCWPKENTWNRFNATVSGHLVRTYPSAAVCHEAQYNAAQCVVAKERWADSTWRTNQTGAYAAILWELGETGQCFINTPREAPCDQGIVPYYSVAAQGPEDVQKAVKFADKHDLYLVVKNTGHDHLGRSSGKGAFSIWTHNMKGKVWHKSFKPKGAPRNIEGVPAVTLQAGEQLIDVYRAAAAENRTFVGGSARTVGAAGGFLTGGGVSPFSHFYGLAVDNLLEVNLVDARGNLRTVNKHTDPDYFYALRGGAGNAWGVIISATYKTHPKPSNIQAVAFQFNTTDSQVRRTILERSLQAIPGITDGGYVGYAIANTKSTESQAFQAIFVQPNATNATYVKAFASVNEISTLPGVQGGVITFDFPDWMGYSEFFLTDPNIATNIIDSGRLLNSDVLTNRASDIVDLMFKYPDFGAGFNSIVKVNSAERDNTAVHESFKDSRGLLNFGANWADDAPPEEKRQAKLTLIELTKRLVEIVGKDTGTYVNEANPYEPDWKNAFWGKKYDRLLSIKRRIDPKNLFVCNRCVGTDIILEP
ncbi:hypothetical protein FQN57_005636 [Myotisia sp. PD_48]|nr:hypothetical protein FQN57_005636 [Myotisia sp. PD_48]